MHFPQFVSTCLVGFSLLIAPLAQAQPANWPSKPIVIVVPFPAGGSTDTIARRFGQFLSQKVGQTVIIENKPGAGGTIGTAYVQGLAADGHTLLFGTVSTHATAPFIYKSLAYDSLSDFTALNQISTTTSVVVVNKSVDVNNLADLVALARSRNDGLTYASNGLGAANHLTTEILRSRLNIPLTNVPYRGEAPSLADTVGGHVDFTIAIVSSAIPHIQSGALKPIAVTSKARSALLPDVPTIAEQGYPDFEAIGWFGLFAPKGMSASLAAQISATVREVVATEAMTTFLMSQGTVPSQATLAGFERIIERDRAYWGKAATLAGIQPE